MADKFIYNADNLYCFKCLSSIHQIYKAKDNTYSCNCKLSFHRFDEIGIAINSSYRLSISTARTNKAILTRLSDFKYLSININLDQKLEPKDIKESCLKYLNIF